LEFAWNAPSMARVTTVEFCFSMPHAHAEVFGLRDDGAAERLEMALDDFGR